MDVNYLSFLFSSIMWLIRNHFVAFWFILSVWLRQVMLVYVYTGQTYVYIFHTVRKACKLHDVSIELCLIPTGFINYNYLHSAIVFSYFKKNVIEMLWSRYTSSEIVNLKRKKIILNNKCWNINLYIII